VSAKSERLLSLVVLLRRGGWVTRRDLRSRVPEYRDATSEEAFQRMFERDKAELRDLGLPIETGPDGAQGEDLGYRVRAVEYDLPSIALDDDDRTILALAAKAWQDAALAGQARLAATKLAVGGGSGSGVGADAEPEGVQEGVPEPEIRLPASGEWFPIVVRAVRERRVLTFDYRGSRDIEYQTRRVHPWVVTARGGTWYVVGYDPDRDGVRAFRTSRIRGAVRPTGDPHAFDRPDREVVAPVVATLLGDRPTAVGTLSATPNQAQSLRRRAVAIELGAGRRGGDLLTVPMTDEEALAADVAATGGHAVALAPPSLVERVHALLTAVLAAHQEPT
jgi:proteasome accessory factor B